MTEKTEVVTLLKNDDGNYSIELTEEQCDLLGLNDGMEFEIVTDGNGIVLKLC